MEERKLEREAYTKVLSRCLLVQWNVNKIKGIGPHDHDHTVIKLRYTHHILAVFVSEDIDPNSLHV